MGVFTVSICKTDLVCMSDSPSSCLCKFFVVLIITSANTLIAYDQEKIEKKMQLFVFTKT